MQMREVGILLGRNAEQEYRSLSSEDKVGMHLRLEQMQCLPILVEEMISNLYPSIVHCPYTDCFQYQRLEVASRVVSSQEDYIYS